MRIRYWSSDVCSSDLVHAVDQRRQRRHRRADRGDHGVAFGQVGDEARIELAEPDQGLALLFHPAHREAALAAIAPGAISQRCKQVVRGNVIGALQVLEDRDSDMYGQSVSVRVEIGGRRVMKTKIKKKYN